MLQENTVIQSRYLVKNLIGRGGMGAVYMAEDTRFNNHNVALKEMLYNDNEQLKIAFEREANLLAQLRHPRLPKVSDFFNENGYQYLVMQYVAGDDLGKMLNDNGKPFAVERVLKWADSLLEILEYLHSQNPPIIHRDIKPQNLKLNSNDEIILIDFGLAKDTLTHLSRLSNPNSLVGFTANYAPLEQVNGDSVTAQTDLYSAAATLYQLLTDTAPASSLTRVQAKIDETADPLVPAHLINSEISPKLSEILARGLSLKRENRPGSAAEMRQNLKEIFNRPQSQLDTMTMPTAKFDAPEVARTMPAMPPTAAFAATSVPNTPASFLNSEPSLPNFSQTPPAKKKSPVIWIGLLVCLLGIGLVSTYFAVQWYSAKTVIIDEEPTVKTEKPQKTNAPEAAGSAAANPLKDFAEKSPDNKTATPEVVEQPTKTVKTAAPPPQVVTQAAPPPKKTQPKPAPPKTVQAKKPKESKSTDTGILQ